MIKNSLRNIPSWVYWDRCLTDAELEKISAYCQQQRLIKGKVYGGNHQETVLEEIRDSKISFIGVNDDTRWFFDKINWVIDQININWYGFNLEGFDEFQYGEYDKNGHYDTHMDMSLGQARGICRKLSMSFLLNDDYKGGEFYIQEGNKQIILPQQKGRILAFPSFLLHGVTPVTEGVRRSIVIWVQGPAFV